MHTIRVTSLPRTVVLLFTKSCETTICLELVRKGTTGKILGVVLLDQKDALILHTLQHHQQEQTTSNLLVKSVLQGSSRFQFDGAIRVEKDAQKTDAYQRNENMLLSAESSVESKPSLEILANDVRCTHGATVQTVSDEQLWYLKTRGIPQEVGNTLLINGFITQVINEIDDDTVRETIRKSILQDTQRDLV